jgi:hypothetical protein
MGTVTVFASASRQKKKRGGGSHGGDQELKRLAIQIAAQLPQDTAEALLVLGYAGKVVREFICDD